MRQDPPDRTRRLVAAARTLGVDLTTAEVIRAFKDAGCRSILLKGPALAQELYEPGSQRPYWDTDLLVAPGDIGRAGTALRGIGFELALDHGEHSGIAEPHAQEWSRGASHRGVDLHWCFPGIEAPHQVAWEALAERTKPIVVAGARGETLDRGGVALLVALHAAHHGTTRGQPLTDLERALERFGADTWIDARSLALRLHAVEAFTAGLLLSPQGKRLAAELALPDVTSARVRLIASQQEPGSIGVLDVLEAPSTRERLRVIRAALVPAPSYMRAVSAVARRGRAGLLLAYLTRALARARQLPAAVRAVRRARRPPARA
jgi:hypothetical protein